MSEENKVPVKFEFTPELKGKLKKILPIVAVVLVLLIIITSCVGGSGGKAANKKALKLLMKQNPSKILSIMPDGYEEAVMDYYDAYVKDRKELKDAIKQETSKVFDSRKIKKIKYLENFAFDLKNPSESLEYEEEIALKGLWDGVGAIWKELKDCEEGYATIIEMTYKNEDGDKVTDETLLCSFKYDGKWYCMNAMSAVYQGAWGYTPSKKR